MTTHITHDETSGRMVATRAYPFVRAMVVADTLADGQRITTFQARYPRWLLAEVNTHGILSRSSQSSRAVPLKVRIEQVRNNPVLPLAWGGEQRGMVAGEPLRQHDAEHAEAIWLQTAKHAAWTAESLGQVGVHKQWASRVLEPYLMVESVITGTDWANFLALRCAPDAQPEFRELALCIQALLEQHQPVSGYLHAPYASPALPDHQRVVVSAARCARVSYYRSDTGKPSDYADDLALTLRLLEDGHMSPFAHIATSDSYQENPRPSNFAAPWEQFRKHIPGERVHGSVQMSGVQRLDSACRGLGLCFGDRPQEST